MTFFIALENRSFVAYKEVLNISYQIRVFRNAKLRMSASTTRARLSASEPIETISFFIALENRSFVAYKEHLNRSYQEELTKIISFFIDSSRTNEYSVVFDTTNRTCVSKLSMGVLPAHAHAAIAREAGTGQVSPARAPASSIPTRISKSRSRCCVAFVRSFVQSSRTSMKILVLTIE